jgi:outer membrane protein OmpA-like peptidoglycan-associated protein
MRKTPTACVLIFMLLVVSGACTRPLAVFHWDARGAAMVKKSRLQKRGWGYPKHNWLSGIICFNEDCLNKAEWKNKQQQHRFKGYKNKKPVPARPDKELIAVAPTNPKQEILSASTVPLNQVQTLKNVYFETGKAQLNASSLGELDELVTLMTQNPSFRLDVSGHTDNVGDESANQQLSQARAKAVVEYLRQQGISQERLSFRGFGSTKPVTTNDTESGKNRNRRVEFIISDGK